MHSRQTIARALASAFVAGSLDVEELVERGSRIMGSRGRWLRPLARRIARAHGGTLRPRKTAIEKFILFDQGFARAYAKYDLRLAYELGGDRPAMCPIDPARAWDVHSPISTTGELADWLGVSIGELDWFADRRRLESKQARPKLRHYRYRALTKRFGQVRLIEAPKPRLKAIQRQIPEGHPRPCAAPSGGARIPRGTIHQDFRGASCRERRCRQAGPPRLLSVDPHRSGASGFQVSRLSGIRGQCAGGTLQQLNPKRGLGRRVAVAKPSGISTTSPKIRATAPSSGRTDITRHRQFVRLSDGLPLDRVGAICRRRVHALC